MQIRVMTIDDYDGVAALQAVNSSGEVTLDIDVLAVGTYDNGYVTVVYPPSKIYESRSSVMAAATLLAGRVVPAA